MKRSIWIAFSIITVASVGVGLLAIGSGPKWTTSSHDALTEFQAAEWARMKLYYPDAVRHLRRALEHDPDFVMAKLHLVQLGKSDMTSDDKKRLLDEIFEADTEYLTPRERFLVERHRARANDRHDLAKELLGSYLKRYPDDPYVLEIMASEAFKRGDADAAETFYKRLVEVSPNWVQGYNQLGYVTMQQGRFTEADEYFTSYRFIAPDQANPHDSLGELYLIRGRYDDAVASFEKALEIKPDFGGSYAHLVGVHILRGDADAAEEAIRRAETNQALPEHLVNNLRCTAHYHQLAHLGAWQQILDEQSSSCFQEANLTHTAYLYTHRAALELGKLEVARRLEQPTSCEEGHKKKLSYGLDHAKAARLHMEGVRLLAEQEYDAAVSRLWEAESILTFTESGIASFKLLNRMMLVEALRGADREEEAQKLEWRVHEVNPILAQRYRDQALVVLSLAF